MAVLYMVATPIGNLQDISLRAVRLLQETPLLAAEDTRVARRLLAGLNIKRPARLLSARAHNEQRAAQQIIKALQAGHDVVYLSDAGTPALSDPGARLAAAVRRAGYPVTPVPGASALTALIAVAGLPDGALHFYGFPPATAAKRRQFFMTLRALDGFSVFYEAPHRIIAMVSDLMAVLGEDGRLVLGRELTKRHEQIVDDRLAAVAAALKEGHIPPRGEFALAVQNPARAAAAADSAVIFEQLRAWLPPRQAAAAAAKISGGNAKELYKRYINS